MDTVFCVLSTEIALFSSGKTSIIVLGNKKEREEVCSLMQAIPKQACHTKLLEKIKKNT